MQIIHFDYLFIYECEKINGKGDKPNTDKHSNYKYFVFISSKDFFRMVVILKHRVIRRNR